METIVVGDFNSTSGHPLERASRRCHDDLAKVIHWTDNVTGPQGLADVHVQLGLRRDTSMWFRARAEGAATPTARIDRFLARPAGPAPGDAGGALRARAGPQGACPIAAAAGRPVRGSQPTVAGPAGRRAPNPSRCSCEGGGVGAGAGVGTRHHGRGVEARAGSDERAAAVGRPARAAEADAGRRVGHAGQDVGTGRRGTSARC